MAVPKRKISKTRKRKRRSHSRLSPPGLAKCPKCDEPVMPHQALALLGERGIGRHGLAPQRRRGLLVLGDISNPVAVKTPETTPPKSPAQIPPGVADALQEPI